MCIFFRFHLIVSTQCALIVHHFIRKNIHGPLMYKYIYHISKFSFDAIWFSYIFVSIHFWRSFFFSSVPSVLINNSVPFVREMRIYYNCWLLYLPCHLSSFFLSSWFSVHFGNLSIICNFSFFPFCRALIRSHSKKIERKKENKRKIVDDCSI